MSESHPPVKLLIRETTMSIIITCSNNLCRDPLHWSLILLPSSCAIHDPNNYTREHTKYFWFLKYWQCKPWCTFCLIVYCGWSEHTNNDIMTRHICRRDAPVCPGMMQMSRDVSRMSQGLPRQLFARCLSRPDLSHGAVLWCQADADVKIMIRMIADNNEILSLIPGPW